MEKISSAAFTDTKPHYDLLDGLRGEEDGKVICKKVDSARGV